MVEITRRRQKEKDKGRRKGYQREGEKKIKQVRKIDKSLNLCQGHEVEGK